MLNDLDRFHLVIDVIDRVPGLGDARGAPAAGDGRRAARARAPTRASTARTIPTIRDWTWPQLSVAILVVNAGSTSLKLSRRRRRRARRGRSTRSRRRRRGVDAVAHRVVHGGDALPRAGRWSTTRCARELEALAELAPLHNAAGARRRSTRRERALPGRAARRRLRHGVPRDDPGRGVDVRAARARGASEWGIRRYGFHGLSVQWAAEQVPACRGSSSATSAAAAR